VVCVVQFIGPSGSGKTSYIVALSRILKSHGLRVAVLKHTHHSVDVPGKDSWRFVEEGGADYSIVVRGSGDRVAIFTRDKSLESIVEWLEGRVDVVLVEGFKDLQLGYKVDLTVDADNAINKALEYLERCLGIKLS